MATKERRPYEEHTLGYRGQLIFYRKHGIEDSSFLYSSQVLPSCQKNWNNSCMWYAIGAKEKKRKKWIKILYYEKGFCRTSVQQDFSELKGNTVIQEKDYNNTTTTPDLNRNKDQGYIILLPFKKIFQIENWQRNKHTNPMGLIYSRD